ncbi:MAG: hypothetical protein ACREJO_15245 [Phycisphaerales bacterium]
MSTAAPPNSVRDLDTQVETMLRGSQAVPASSLDQQVQAAVDLANQAAAAALPTPPKDNRHAAQDIAKLDEELAAKATLPSDDEFAEASAVLDEAPAAVQPPVVGNSESPHVAAAATSPSAAEPESTKPATHELIASEAAPATSAASETPAAKANAINTAKRAAEEKVEAAKVAAADQISAWSKAAEPLAIRLARLPKNVHQTCAWIGVCTLFLAGVTWVFAMMRSPTDFVLPERTVHKAPEPAKPEAGHGESSGHGEAKPKKAEKPPKPAPAKKTAKAPAEHH